MDESAKRRIHEFALGDTSHNLGQDHRRFVFDHGHLAHAVLAEDGDGLSDGLVGMGVDERRE